MLLATATPAPRVALPWVIRLRYAMAAGQILTVLFVNLILDIDLPLRWIVIAPCLVLLSNLWLSRRAGSAESSLIAWMFVLDTLSLTAVLLLTGGPTNPFTLLYLVHITLSATILNQRQTWAIGVLASLCFGLLFWHYRPIAALEMHHLGTGVNLHLIGMWAAFALGSLLVAMFSGKISALLRQNEESLLLMQQELARKDRLASLVTLAAGAAHELSTPLGTIAVVAKDLELYATRTLRDSAVADDSRLIRTEVDRCTNILRRLSIEGAEPAGESSEPVPAAALLEAARQAFPPTAPLSVIDSGDDLRAILEVPRHAVEQALVALIKNALEASPAGSPVTLSASRASRSVRFEVRDHGHGMSLDTLRHAGEPFFTTKEPGKGMGLGVFLVRTLAGRLGGSLTYESLPGEGTSAHFEIPLTPTRHDGNDQRERSLSRR
jgi:two-component system sensor histidine kinase RegB